jgi:TolA-binding protein
MRRIISLLVVFCLAIVFCGCAKDQYSIERELWHLKKKAAVVLKNPDGAPPQAYERVIGSFTAFVAKHGNNVLVVDADFAIARLYMSQKEYDKARTQLKGMLRKYAKAQVVLPEILFMMGTTYEIQGRFDLALEQYKKLIDTYPLSKRGFGLPFVIGDYYRQQNMPEKMRAAFDDAIKHYEGLAQKYSDSPVALRSLMMVASSYAQMRQWQKSVDTLETIVTKFHGKTPLDGVLLQAAVVYKKDLNNSVRAKAALERLIKDYPGSNLAPTAKSLLKQL